MAVRWGRAAGLAFLATLAGCGGRIVGVPPCNALIVLFGAADLHLDCPNAGAIRIIERQPK